MSEPTADTGVLTLDAAVGLLTAESEQEAPPEAAEETPPEPEAEPAPEEASGDEGTDEEATEAPEAEEAVPAVEPPPFWNAENKDVFAKLPAEAQEAIRSHEDQREAAVKDSMRKAAEARNAATVEAAKLAQLAPRLADVAERAEALFERPVEGLTDSQGRPLDPVKWSEINWPAWRTADPIAYTVAWTRYQAELGEVQEARAARDLTQAKAAEQQFNTFVQEQGEALKTLNPELANDPAKRQAVGQYLVSRGYDPQALRGVSALDIDTAYKAMRFDQLQAKAKEAPRPGQTPPRTPQAQTKPVRPSAAASSAPPQKRAVQEASARFSKSGSLDDAVRLMLAEGGG